MSMQTQKVKQTDNLLALPNLIDDTIKAIPDVPDHERGQFFDTMAPGKLRVDLPRTPDLVTAYLRDVGSESWTPNKYYWASETGYGDVYYEFFHATLPVTLTVGFMASLEGATCRKVQTGTREIPIYELVCDETE